MHAGLLASSGDVGTASSLDRSRADEESRFSILPVLHVINPFFNIVEFFPRFVRRGQLAVVFAKVSDERSASETQKNGASPLKLLRHGSGVSHGETEEVMEVFTRVIEVVGEDDVLTWEGHSDDIFNPFGTVSNDLNAKQPRVVSSAIGQLSEQLAKLDGGCFRNDV